MRESLAAVFNEARTPTHCSCEEVTDKLRPLIRVALKVQKQVAELREKMVLASMEDPTYDGNVERLEQTLKSMERRAAAITAEGRGLRDDFLQLNRYAREIEADVIAHLAAMAAREAAAPEAPAVSP